ncbi:uncharacterized protein JN550_000850 [Neoarthrinium moseri]|uniref:uncharacterized protein n=1 Tax=Neoarthrinium moseri TaxID=1658444 RepID=UPI001FDB055F|nr:uncharacterized protein JN550_000850 [Neoarthrinium moseri]KAI1876778.1 hypothetical protein JN550_000850 [Neoarthrinium moseri]
MATASDEDEYRPSDVESVDAGAEADSGHNDLVPVSMSRRASSSDGRAGFDDDDDLDASSLSAASITSRKRRYLPDYSGAPLKRQRRTFNPDYLAILNQDIADAAANLVGEDVSHLNPSQIGAVRWSDIEKEAFFSALGRLGRDDLPGIAARIGTKSQLEVRQYIMLLSQRERTRRDDTELRRKTLRPADLPAAAELSHDCCAALDEAADDLSLRQENYETSAEEKRWGDHWLITQQTLKELEAAQNHAEMPFLDLFVARNWLRLSDRIFLNSKIPDFNWRYVSEEAPAIRATALSDFHALVVSVTKRLVASTLFMAGMRIKAKREYMPTTRNLVRATDVEAAAASLSIKTSSREFWARAAGRLRIDIVQDKTDPSEEASDEGHSDDEEAVMSYREVEAALGGSQDGPRHDSAQDSSVDTEDSSEEDEQEHAEMAGADSDLDIDDTLNDEAIKQDMREAMHFSADFEGTTRARQGLQGRIEAEHRMEAEAESSDLQASREEEARLWSMMRQSDEPISGGTATKEQAGGQVRRPVHEPIMKDWRDGIRYVSPWETRADVE